VRARLYDLLGLFAVALAAHGLLLLNDGIYWDDWIIYPQLEDRDWASIHQVVHESGMTPINAGFLEAFAYSPLGVFTHKAAVFLLIVLLAWFVYLIAVEVGLPRLDALLIAVLTTVFPGFQDWVLLVTASSILDYVVFLAATFALLRAERVTGGPRVVLRLAAVVGFIGSFSLSSLLVFYLGAFLLWAYVAKGSAPVERFVRERWPLGVVLAALPAVYWPLQRTFFQPSGVYVEVNTFVGLDQIVYAFGQFFLNGIGYQLVQSATTLAVVPVLVLLVVLLAVGVWLWRRGSWMPPLPTLGWGMVGFGLGLLLLAMIPYAAVGKYPWVHGWETRHDLLVSLPLAIVLVAVVRLALRSGAAAWAGVGVLVLLAVCFAAAGAEDYAALQARWAEDQGVMADLKANGNSGDYSVYWVRQRIQGPEDYYRFYEWSAMFERVYGNQTRVGLDERQYGPDFLGMTKFFEDRYNLAGFDPRGCQADMVITGSVATTHPTQVGLRYVYLKLFDPAGLAAFENGLVSVKITPRTSSAATDCVQ
jgi:hypothetical protein